LAFIAPKDMDVKCHALERLCVNEQLHRYYFSIK
jgi:hypothetical protein